MNRILVVDDDPLVCEIVADCLRQDMSAYVNAAQNGRDGALLIKGYQFDLAVIDAVLPDMDGLALAELAANQHTGVLLTSGDPEACETFDRFNLPHLRKPFDLDALVGAASVIIRDTGENIRRVRTAAAQLGVHMEVLAAKQETSRRLMEQAKAGTSS
jgi:two-component system OmpR family response regulator